MKKAIGLFVFSILLLITAIIVGNQAIQEQARSAAARQNGGVIPDSSVPTVVLPPESLPQFQGISVYSPQKPDPAPYIDPQSDNENPTEESASIQAGIM